MELPYKIERVDEEINRHLVRDFEGYKYFVQTGPEKWIFPNKYEQDAFDYFNFEVRPDDAFVMGVPRSGTTLTQALVWLIVNDLDFKTAEEKSLLERVPFFDHNIIVSEPSEEILVRDGSETSMKVLDSMRNSLKNLREMKGRRTTRTHLPFCLLPPALLTCGAKVVYVARNPKDVIVSFYHIQRLVAKRTFIGSFPEYYDYFEKDLVIYCPYWAHIKQAWEKRHFENVCFIFYEDYLKDLRGSITKVAKFFGRDLTPEELDKMEDHLSFERFKSDKATNKTDFFKEIGYFRREVDSDFIRKGKSGGWRDHFDEELGARADEWIRKNSEDIGIRFPCE